MSNTLKSIFVLGAVFSSTVGLAACAQLGTMATGSGLQAPGIPGASSDPAQANPAAPSGGESNPGTTASAAKTEEKKDEKQEPTTVSVKIRSACAKTAKVFYGDKPGFSSGTGSSVTSNSVSNKTFKPGELMWVTDDKNNGLASVKIEGSTKEIEIGSDCTSIKAK